MHKQTRTRTTAHSALHSIPGQRSGVESLASPVPGLRALLSGEHPFPMTHSQTPGAGTFEPGQERTCCCGQQIRVFYTRARCWTPVFRLADRFPGERIESCPGCGAKLDINELR